MESDVESDVAPVKRRRAGYESDDPSERSYESSEENDDEEETPQKHGKRHRDFRDVRVRKFVLHFSKRDAVVFLRISRALVVERFRHLCTSFGCFIVYHYRARPCHRIFIVVACVFGL